LDVGLPERPLAEPLISQFERCHHKEGTWQN
jgi:hypothetical protein